MFNTLRSDMKSNNKITLQTFYRLFFWGLLAVAVFLRLPFASVERLWPDEALYAWNALRIFQHPELIFSREITDFHPPLFSILLSFWHWVLPPLKACHAMMFFMNITGIIAIYSLGKKIQGEFLGCLAALMLGFNLLYFTVFNYILIDSVLAVFMIVFFQILSSASQPKITRADFYLGLITSAVILLKWSGGLVLPLIVLYYWMAFPRWTLRERAVKAAVPLIFGVITVGFLLWRNFLIFGTWIPQVFTMTNDAYSAPFIYYVRVLLVNLVNRPFVPFLLFGLWMVFKNRNPHQQVHGLWVVLSLSAISLMSNKDMRFLLPVIPSVVVLIGIAADALCRQLEKRASENIVRPVFLVVTFGFLLAFSYPKVYNDAVRQGHSYTGYREASAYIKEELVRSPEAVILAGSPRMIRYYTGINFKEFGGSIVPIPKSEEEFKQMIALTSGPILLEVDLWEGMQPKWIYPLRAQNVELLKTYGFELERMVRVNISGTPEGADKAAVWCFRRPVSNP